MTRGRNPQRGGRVTQAVVATDARGRIRTWDAGARLLLGSEPDAVLGRPIAEVLADDSSLSDALEAQQAIAAGEDWTGELSLRRAGEAPFSCLVTATSVTDDEGRPLAAVWTVTDIRAQRRFDQTLRRLAALAESSADAVISTTTDGVITSWNTGAEELYGHRASDAIGRRVSILAPDHRAASVEATLEAIRCGESRCSYEAVGIRSDGSEIDVLVTVVPVHDADGAIVGMSATSRDLTQLRKLERTLSHRDTHDDLTGLANRRALEGTLEAVIDRAEIDRDEVALLFVDVDRFATINDAWGHSAGDALLTEIADRLRGVVRSSDTVARFGGDEFVVLCESSGAEAAQGLAARIHRALAEPVMFNGHRVACTASIGVAVAPPYDAQSLLRFAAAAAVDAKRRGRAHTRVYDAEMARRAQTRLNFASELGAALADNKLELRYQPMFDVATGAVVGVEALTRWVHPEHGNIAPSEFLRLANDTGLITELDRWALQRACADAARLRRAGVLPQDAYVSVNVSERSLVDPKLTEMVTDALVDAQLPPRALVLEITETGMMTDPDTVERALHGLHARGVGISLDDFGTGYASLAHLRRFPLTSLKIDRVFVDAMTNARDELTIVASVIDLARALGVTTIAEGVETRAQLDLLRRLGCAAAQGFLWSEALSPVDLNRLLTTMGGEPRRVVEPVEDATPPAAADNDEVAAEHGLLRMLQLHQEGQSATTIAAALNADSFRTPQGQRWHSRTVTRALARLALPTV